MPEVDIRVEGVDSMVLGLRADHERLGREVKRALDEALDEGEKVMRLMIPDDTGALRQSIEREPVRFFPGGLGGGGVYRGELNVGAGIPYLNIVVEGSGIYGPFGTPIVAGGEGNIRPKGNSDFYTRTGAKFMHWQKDGKHFFKKSVKGQKPQTEWLHASRERANEVLARKIRTLDLRH